MSTEMIGVIGILILLVLLFLRFPVAIAMMLVGFIGYGVVRDWDNAFSIAGMVPYSTVANYTFSIIPLFLLMGYFMFYGKIATDMFDTFNKWLGHYKGGVCYATILGGAGFGAANGSGPASTAALSRIAIPEMRRLGINNRLAYGVVASAGPLATMIPPSMLMIIYAILAEQPVGELLIAGILPGLLIAVMLGVTVYVLVKIKPELAPSSAKATIKERVSSLKGVWSVAILIGLVFGGLYVGLFTPTEAGAAGAVIALIIVILSRRFTWERFTESIFETIKTTSMIFFIVVGSFLLGYFLTVTRLPNAISMYLTSLDVAPIYIMIGICLMYLILGMFIDMISALFITIPIIMPAVIELGYDPIWFGVIVVLIAEISLVTPPFGMSIFVIRGVIRDSTYMDILIGIFPFIISNLIVLVLLFIFPQIALFLPSFMN